MPTLLDFRRRIRSVKNTQQITRAMKFIAAARLRKAQEGVMAARPYAREILRILRSAVTRIEEPMHPLLERRPEESILVIVMTGDRGLAGPFNANVLRYATTFLREQASKKIRVMAIGKKGRDVLRKRNYEFAGEYLNVSLNVDFSKAKEIGAKIVELYSAREVDAVYVIYNEFKSVIVQRLCAQKLLPIEPEVLKGPEAQKGKEATARRRLWITSTRSRRPKYLNTSYYDISTRKCSGFYWSPPPPSTARAWRRWIRRRIMPAN